MARTFFLAMVAFAFASPLRGDEAFLKEVLGKKIIGPQQTLKETEAYLAPRYPRMPEVKTRGEWEETARRIRQRVLDEVVFRGEAAKWRDAKVQVKFLDTIPGGPGYRIRKLRFEALPGLWIPALLYEPDSLSGKMPVCLAVNGHEGAGKAAPYKQERCINLAKRGILTLNVEWLGMGQLRSAGYTHYRMNQLDLCGTSGLAPFYLNMTRGLDLLLSLPNADPRRVAVSGLSGGGWQTIIVSSLDTRVTLANPVAGYSAFETKLRHHKDLGDSEQTPTDLGTVANYTHLTALRAPRPTLLTYNSKDQCCFEAGYALPPLLDAARPIYRLYDREKALRSHVNDDPGTHNYLEDNREAFYRVIGDHFFPDDEKYPRKEIPSKEEVKTAEELTIPLPEDNKDFNALARELMKELPRAPALPEAKAEAQAWQESQRKDLSSLVKGKGFSAVGMKGDSTEREGLRATPWTLKLDKDWTVPVVEVSKGEPKKTVILLNDAGRKADPVNAGRLLGEGYRVLAVDLFYFGECQIASRDFLFALQVATVGDRPLGLQASQLAAVARWAGGEFKQGPVTVVAVGPRMSLIATVAAALDEKALGRLELDGSLGSLKEVIEASRAVNQWPEVFCFGLLEWFDVRHLVALAAPRAVVFRNPDDRVKAEMKGLKGWYATLGVEFDPLTGK